MKPMLSLADLLIVATYMGLRLQKYWQKKKHHLAINVIYGWITDRNNLVSIN